MLVQHVAEVFLQQGAPQPPGLFGDASGMPGFDKLQTVIHWFGWLVLSMCVIGIGWFAAQLVLSHRDPETTANQRE